eukprot:CAMPEP_0197052494 /NCGR_PEP_ID=MMETSP1384-20130603/26969_1 /TAXON_ID=29189 /ORGANISM="Ammonia sp." /LENGTH=354 /DNA_ID=CAMNT_0042485243 /DNA_START=349 /DNA_END=1412 /DNA_ORIENTATION=+
MTITNTEIKHTKPNHKVIASDAENKRQIVLKVAICKALLIHHALPHHRLLHKLLLALVQQIRVDDMLAVHAMHVAFVVHETVKIHANRAFVAIDLVLCARAIRRVLHKPIKDGHAFQVCRVDFLRAIPQINKKEAAEITGHSPQQNAAKQVEDPTDDALEIAVPHLLQQRANIDLVVPDNAAHGAAEQRVAQVVNIAVVLAEDERAEAPKRSQQQTCTRDHDESEQNVVAAGLRFAPLFRVAAAALVSVAVGGVAVETVLLFVELLRFGVLGSRIDGNQEFCSDVQEFARLVVEVLELHCPDVLEVVVVDELHVFAVELREHHAFDFAMELMVRHLVLGDLEGGNMDDGMGVLG